MANQYSFFLGQNGGGGDADLKIVYGTATPAQSDRDKLWVACNEPAKVLMNNNLNLQNGNLTQIETINPLKIENGALGCHMYNNKIYFGKAAIAASDNGLYEKDLATGVIRRIGNEALISVVNGVNGQELYEMQHNETGGSITGVALYKRNVDANTREYIGGLSHSRAGFSFGVFAKNKIFYRTDDDSRFIYCYNLSTNTDDFFCSISIEGSSVIHSMVYDGNNYIYCLADYSSSIVNTKLYRVNVDTGEVIQAADFSGKYDLSHVILGYYNNSVLIFFMDTSVIHSYIYSYNVATNTFSKIDNTDYARYSTANYTNAITQNGYAYFATNAKYSLVVTLTNNNLAINYNTNNNRWKAINADNLEVGVNPVSVYLGNSSNQGVKQTAKLWNGSSWVEI